MILLINLRFSDPAVRVRAAAGKTATPGALLRYLVALAVGGVVRTAPQGSFFTFLSGILLMPDL
jgi:hypothetical protein